MTRVPNDRGGEAWDDFIDSLDRAGQAGAAGDITVPTQLPTGLAGKRFGDLTRADVRVLARTGSQFGRRGDTVEVLWEDMQRRASGRHRLTRRKK
jgi:hypothetical protein